MNDVMRPLYCFFLIGSGGCVGFLWLFTCVPPRDSRSLLGQTQTMVQSDRGWKFISYMAMVAAAIMFLCNLINLFATL